MGVRRYPPGVDRVRRRLVGLTGEMAEQLRPGVLTGLCRLALRPASVDEVVAEAADWLGELLGEPSLERLAALVGLLAAELYGRDEPAPVADAASSAAEWFTGCGCRRVWICRGQLLTLADGRRLDAVLDGAGLEVRRYGTTNRCRPAELEAGLMEGDGVLHAARGDFALTGFVRHPEPAELAALAGAGGLPAAVLLDAWREPAPSALQAPLFVSPEPGAGLACGIKARRPPDEAALRRLFATLRRITLTGSD